MNFEVVHTWVYRYLLRRIDEVAEEYGMVVEYVSEENTLSTCPICGIKDRNHKRTYRGLFKYYVRSEVFNADLMGAYNTILEQKPQPQALRPNGVGVKRLRPAQG